MSEDDIAKGEIMLNGAFYLTLFFTFMAGDTIITTI
jgi:hypothetical protein